MYALGGVLHFALTGRVPFEREGDEAKLWAQLSAPPPVPSALRRGLPASSTPWSRARWPRTPDDRYPSAGDLGRAARAAAAGRVPTEPERMVARGAAAPGGAPTEPGLAAEASTRTARAARPRAGAGAPLLVGGGRRAGAVGGRAVAVAVRDERAAAMRDDAAGRRVVARRRRRRRAATATAKRPRAVGRRSTNVGHRPNGIALAGGDLWVTSARQPY